jgi:hypothetical protein
MHAGEDTHMPDQEFDLDAYMTSKQKLDFDPELGRGTITFIPGDPPAGGNALLVDDRGRDVFAVDAILDDIALDGAPPELYPLIPPVVFRWCNIPDRLRSEIALKLRNSRVVYDETHPKAAAATERNRAWSRVVLWYLTTTLAGNVPIEARLADDNGAFQTLMADDLIKPSDKAVMSLRNAYITNFSVIGMRIVNTHMPAERPNLGPLIASMKPNVAGFLRDFRKSIPFPRHLLGRPAPKSNDLWAVHANWLTILFAFGRSTEAQRAVLFNELLTADRHGSIMVSLGDNIISGTFVHPSRGQVLRDRQCGGFILEMIVRGLVAVDLEARTVRLTAEGANLLATMATLEDSFRYWEFIDRHDDTVDPDSLPSAHEWIMEFFNSMKTIADKVADHKDIAE